MNDPPPLSLLPFLFSSTPPQTTLTQLHQWVEQVSHLPPHHPTPHSLVMVGTGEMMATVLPQLMAVLGQLKAVGVEHTRRVCERVLHETRQRSEVRRHVCMHVLCIYHTLHCPSPPCPHDVTSLPPAPSPSPPLSLSSFSLSPLLFPSPSSSPFSLPPLPPHFSHPLPRCSLQSAMTWRDLLSMPGS